MLANWIAALVFDGAGALLVLLVAEPSPLVEDAAADVEKLDFVLEMVGLLMVVLRLMGMVALAPVAPEPTATAVLVAFAVAVAVTVALEEAEGAPEAAITAREDVALDAEAEPEEEPEDEEPPVSEKMPV